MLVSRRFTKTLTEASQARLEKVLDNSKPLTRREDDRGTVVAIQAALSDLNQGYLSSAEVDGFFGSITARAVEAFQRDYGLFADGVVGRQTLTELDQIYSSDLFRDPQGVSIHVGINFVDEQHYGNSYPLSACVNDAHDFRDLARALGYFDTVLINEQATTANFIAAMRQAATNLFSGDSLFVTLSCHGSQMTNDSVDMEIDGLDETLCFFDRMMIDDEVYALLSELRPGVNVTMLYDSCHSETVTRFVPRSETAFALEQERLEDIRVENRRNMTRQVSCFDPDLGKDMDENEGPNRFVPYNSNELGRVIDGDRVEQNSGASIGEDKLDEIVNSVIETSLEIEGSKARFIRSETDVNRLGGIYERNRVLYDAVKTVIGDREHNSLECLVVAFSACQDNQTTLDGIANGFFTGNVLSVWGGGSFTGSVRKMHNRLVSESSPGITPALNTYGGPRADARIYLRPFAF